MVNKNLEEGVQLQLSWDKLQLVAQGRERVLPVVIQDSITKDVLCLAYIHAEGLRESLRTKRVVLYSTSRQETWYKGKTSGDYLELVEVRVNCEQNSLLFLVRPLGQGVCHTKNSFGKSRKSCFYRRLLAEEKLEFLES
ncbi:MAG: phosphoribosyl-AMP cyclohydrolase [Leptospiraceae bacterium]|nr:phosphoribosyl-AMP cyclohydrolase [Leptospiraceae bacterium]MDW8305569.1 phosphoribosyl-AMP cyclohydrolase [Leptospiraceae bacterium]